MALTNKTLIATNALRETNEPVIEDGEFRNTDTSNEMAILSAIYKNKFLQSMTEQCFECEWANVHVKREERVLDIQWWIKDEAGKPEDFYVFGVTCPVKLKPDKKDLYLQEFVSGHGNLKATMQGAEGVTYFFHMMFVSVNKVVAEDIEGSMKHVVFQVGIPLSPEKKALLSGRVPPEQAAADRIQSDMEDFLKKQDVLDSMIERAIQKIKAKGLPPEEERERIEDLREYVAQTKDKLGM